MGKLTMKRVFRFRIIYPQNLLIYKYIAKIIYVIMCILFLDFGSVSLYVICTRVMHSEVKWKYITLALNLHIRLRVSSEV